MITWSAVRERSRRRSRGRRWAYRAIAVLVVLFCAWLAFCLAVIANPRVDTIQKADAIFVLGAPDVDGRADYGMQLAQEGYAPVLAISAVDNWQYFHRDECRQGDSPQVLCFVPEPATTQGEARQLRDYAQQHGWKRVIVVTSSYHISRARMILERCFPGELIMTSPPGAKHSIKKDLYEAVYQSSAYLKAELITRGC